MDELVNIVDETGKVIGEVLRSEAAKKKLRYRVSKIIVFNLKHELLVHQRAGTTGHNAGMWDVMVGETVKAGESFEEAASRGIREELGCEAKALTPLFTFPYEDAHVKRVYAIFCCVIDGKMKLQNEEVQAAEFIPISKLQALIPTRNFVQASLEAFKRYSLL